MSLDGNCLMGIMDEFGVAKDKALLILSDTLDGVNAHEALIGRDLSVSEGQFAARQKLNEIMNNAVIHRELNNHAAKQEVIERVTTTHDMIRLQADEMNRNVGGYTPDSAPTVPGKSSWQADPIRLMRSAYLGMQSGVTAARNSVAAIAEGTERQFGAYLGKVSSVSDSVRTYFKLLKDPTFTYEGRVKQESASLQVARDALKFLKDIHDGTVKVPDHNTATPAEWLGYHTAVMLNQVANKVRDAGGAFAERIASLPVSHDASKIAGMSRSQFVQRAYRDIDWEHSFGGTMLHQSQKARETFLSEKYDRILGTREKYDNDIATQVGHMPTILQAQAYDWVLKDADTWHQYNKDMGREMTILDAVQFQISSTSKAVALMEKLGPDVIAGHNSLIDRLKADVQSGRLYVDPKNMDAVMGELSASYVANGFRNMDSRITRAFAEVAGETMHPANRQMAQISASIRAVKNMAVLGKAAISTLFADPTTTLMSMAFKNPDWAENIQSLAHEWAVEIGAKHGKSELKQLAEVFHTAYLDALGVGNSKFSFAEPGAMSKLQGMYFKHTGLSAVVDSGRAVAFRMNMNYFGENAHLDFHALPTRAQHILNMHDIAPSQWDLMRDMVHVEPTSGRKYLIPELVHKVEDMHFADIQSRGKYDEYAHNQPNMPGTGPVNQRQLNSNPQVQIAVDREAFMTRPENRRFLLSENRFQDALEKHGDIRSKMVGDLYRMLNDEVRYGVIDADAKTRFYALRGTNPGTITGEFLRFASMYKSAPIAVMDRIHGRGFMGFDPRETSGMMALPGGLRVHQQDMASYIASTFVGGYIAMSLKDIVSGKTPRPLVGEYGLQTMQSALLQGGAGALYADTLAAILSEYNHSVSRLTLGPIMGDSAMDFVSQVWGDAKAGNKSAGDKLNFLINNTPYANVFWSRGLLDYSILWHLKEMARPGAFDASRRNAARNGQVYMGTPMGVQSK